MAVRSQQTSGKSPRLDQRYPAVKLSGTVYVATRSPDRRMPVRHLDAQTAAIRAVAGSNAQDYIVQQLIKKIDMGQLPYEMGDAFADGSDFQPI